MIAETRRLEVFAVALVVCATWAVLSYWSAVAQPRYSVSIVLAPRLAPLPRDISRDPRLLGEQRGGWSRDETIAPDGGDDEDKDKDDQSDRDMPDDMYNI